MTQIGDDLGPESRAIGRVAALSPYQPGMQPGESGWVKLNTNENPYPPSPAVRQAILGLLGGDGARLRLYPPPASSGVRAAIAAHHGVPADCVLAGNGSDDVLNLLARAFADGNNPAVYPVPSYSLYPVLLGIQGARVEEIPFDRSMRLPLEELARSGANICFLTSPNAPTGVGFSPADVEAVLSAFAGIVVVDEAYAPFAATDSVGLLAQQPRLVITRTLSKAWSLAGLRVGYALADPAVIAILDRVRDSYNLDALAQAGAIAAFEDADYMRAIVARIVQTRDEQAAVFDRWGWFTYPSQANFLFTEPRTAAGQSGAGVAESLFETLRRNRILVRYFGSHPFTCSFLRITVGTDEEMKALTRVIESWLKNAPQK